jgi:hypothetical protein
MRQFFSREVPLGNFNCLTYMAFMLAKIWEQGEHLRRELVISEGSTASMKKFDSMLMTVSLGCVFAEQVAVEGGTQYQLGWLMTGLEEPPFAQTSLHKPKQGGPPHGKFPEAQWIAAQLAYLRDLDVMSERVKKRGNAQKTWEEGKGEKK